MLLKQLLELIHAQIKDDESLEKNTEVISKYKNIKELSEDPTFASIFKDTVKDNGINPYGFNAND